MFKMMGLIGAILIVLAITLDAKESMRKCQETNSYETCVVILR